jgi:1-acyl-sn-glycerol-3-phosphate acyltransferase
MHEPEAAMRLDNKKLTFPVGARERAGVTGRILYWWSWFAAGSMLLVIGAPAIAFFWLINERERLYPLALWGARAWLAVSGVKVNVSGREHLDADTEYIFASNHRSYLDTATLFRFTGKRIGIVAKKELLKVPVLGQGMSFVNIIAIDRTNPERARRSMEKAREVMHRGYSFGVFVEGTRALPGELLPFKKGAFHLAQQTEAPIVPVALKNTDRLMGKHTGVAYTGTIEMVLLPPIASMDKTVDELLLATRAAIACELQRAGRPSVNLSSVSDSAPA